MLLSEAILKGRVFIKEPNATDYCRCAIGMATAALKGYELGGINPSWDPLMLAFKTWPWIVLPFPVPEMAELPDGMRSAEQIISAAFFNVMRGGITLEQLVDWVRSVEPAEREEVPVTESVSEAELVEA